MAQINRERRHRSCRRYGEPISMDGTATVDAAMQQFALLVVEGYFELCFWQLVFRTSNAQGFDQLRNSCGVRSNDHFIEHQELPVAAILAERGPAYESVNWSGGDRST